MPDEPAPMTATDFLGRFFDGTDGWIHVFAIDRTTGERHIVWAPTGDPAKLTRAAKPFVDTSCVWFGVAPRQADLGVERRGQDIDCLGIPALWLDLDVQGPNHAADDLPPTKEAALELLGDFPLPASILVDTGGGYQAYWLFHELVALDEARILLNRWGARWTENGRVRGWHVDNVFDVPRILRLPATWNRKNDPVAVEVVWADWDRRYNPDDLDQWCIDPPEPERTLTERTIPYIGPERPGDAYNAATDPGQVLEAAGWELDHTDRGAGDRHYRAPHHTGERGTTGATVYADGHTTIWSDTYARRHNLAVKRPYDAFGLYTHIHHQGDWRTASTELAAKGYGTAAANMAAWIAAAETAVLTKEDEDLALAHMIDWPDLWAAVRPDEDWLARPLIPRGRALALYAPAKAGKSSVVLAIVAACATGKPVFGRWPCEPISVLYLDYEMVEADLKDRMIELGYGPDDDLTNLHYALLPSLPPLDTQEGAQALLKLVRAVDAKLVVVDTFTRAVEGKENDSDTVRAFYRHTGRALKAAGISVLRTDHSGKDLDRGQRGSSAKADDVDVVWQLARTDNGVTIKRTHSRLSWIPDTINLDRTETDEGRVIWGVVEETFPDGTKEVAELLDTLGVSVDTSSRQAQQALREAGSGRRRVLVVAAQRWRQVIAISRFGTPKTSPNGPEPPPTEKEAESVTEPEAKPLQEPDGNQAEPPSESQWEPVRTSLEVRNRYQDHPADQTVLDLTDDPIFGTPKETP